MCAAVYSHNRVHLLIAETENRTFFVLCFLLQALILLQVMGWIFLPVFIASGVSYLHEVL